MAGALETSLLRGATSEPQERSFPALGGDACALQPDDAALEHALRATGLPSSFQRPRLVAAALVALLLAERGRVRSIVGLRSAAGSNRPTATDVSAAHAAVEAVRSQAEVEAAESLQRRSKRRARTRRGRSRRRRSVRRRTAKALSRLINQGGQRPQECPERSPRGKCSGNINGGPQSEGSCHYPGIRQAAIEAICAMVGADGRVARCGVEPGHPHRHRHARTVTGGSEPERPR